MTVTQLQVRVSKIVSPGDVEPRWRALEQRADASFFTSWRWIGAWLHALHASNRLDGGVGLLEAERDGVLVGLAVLSRGPGSGEGRVYLNQTGHPDLDSIFIEYNGFLVDRTDAGAIRRGIFAALGGQEFGSGPWAWRSLMIAGAEQPTFDDIQTAGIPHRLLQHAVCRRLDLAAAPRTQDGALQLLGRNTRQQIRRAARHAERNGPLHVRVAANAQQRADDLAELRTLHEARWRERKGHAGAFTTPFFSGFVEALLAPSDAAPSETGVDLLRISAGTTTIGILLNFRYGRDVYSYLNGFAYESDNRAKPGLVSHMVAAQHYIAAGMSGYHFMAGDAQYKTSLGPSTEDLYWLMLRRTDAVSRAQDMVWRMGQSARRFVRSVIRSSR